MHGSTRPPLFNMQQNNRFPYYNQQTKPNFYPRQQNWRHRNQAPTTLSDSEKLWCETCDRGFNSENLLSKHKQEHQKCNIDGCQFVAHPNVIIKHIQMQHSSGLYKKIANISTSEDIQKWRDERKKMYPTKSNIDKKNAATREKIERGEKMGLKHEKFTNKSNLLDTRKRRFNSSKEFPPRNNFKRQKQETNIQVNNIHKNNNKKVQQKMFNKTLPPVFEKRKLKPFEGILSLVIENIEDKSENTPDSNIIIEDDDINAQPNKINTNTDEPNVCGALSSLMFDYGSSDEEDANGVTASNKQPNDVTNQNTESTALSNNNMYANKSTIITENENVRSEKKSEVTQKNNTECQEITSKKCTMDSKTETTLPTEENVDIASGEESGPEEVKTTKSDSTENLINGDINSLKSKSSCAANKPRKQVPPFERKEYRRTKPKLPSTLLTKLLAKEMKHERNVVLQCIRYIVNNNYFSKTTK